MAKRLRDVKQIIIEYGAIRIRKNLPEGITNCILTVNTIEMLNFHIAKGGPHMAGHICPSWMGYILLNPLRKLIENPDKLLGSFINKGMVVVEPGCGMGYFTLPLARMVGPTGRVVALDLQEKMLLSLSKRVQKAGLSDRIDIRQATDHSMGIEDLAGAVDVLVAIHMVHEVKDQNAFFKEIYKALKQNGRLIIIEPKGHVSYEKFSASLSTAEQNGFLPDPLSGKMTGRKALLYKPDL